MVYIFLSMHSTEARTSRDHFFIFFWDFDEMWHSRPSEFWANMECIGLGICIHCQTFVTSSALLLSLICL